jgi:hypothetical protein
MSTVKRMQPSFDHAQFPDTSGHLSLSGFPQLPSPQAHVHQFRHFHLRVPLRLYLTLHQPARSAVSPVSPRWPVACCLQSFAAMRTEKHQGRINPLPLHFPQIRRSAPLPFPSHTGHNSFPFGRQSPGLVLPIKGSPRWTRSSLI